MLKSFIKNPVVVFAVLFINLQLCFLAAYISPLPINWMIFVFVLVMTLLIVSHYKRLRSTGLIKFGKNESRASWYICLGMIVFLLIGGMGFVSEKLFPVQSVDQALIALMPLFVLVPAFLANLYMAEIAIFDDGIMVRGLLFLWKEIDAMSVSQEGYVILKTTYYGLFKYEYPLRTDPQTCDVLMAELQKHGFAGSEVYASIKPETFRLS